MRLIGNKTRLLGHIEDLLRQRGFARGTLIDIFSGTSSVGRHFKTLGYRVIANDHLSSSYTQAVAGVEVSRFPPYSRLLRAHRPVVESAEFRRSLPGLPSPELSFTAPSPLLSAVGPPEGSREGTAVGRRSRQRRSDPSLPLRQAVHLLDRFLRPREGLIFRNYCPGGPAGRMYFRDEHGRKIDGCLEFLREAHAGGLLSHGELHLLLAALIDSADRVANISGTYGAYLKKWQVNTNGEMRLETPQVVESPHRNVAHQEDSNELIRTVSGDVLYVDPPYNHRQYAANYHVLDIIAEHHRVRDLEAYESFLYGKTGLRPYGELKSRYCVRPGARAAAERNVLTAMNDLILSSRVGCVVVSYSEEGLLSREEIGSILARFAGVRSFNFREDLLEIDFQRFRSDSNRAPLNGRGGRSYRTLEGREPGRTEELLFFAARPGARRAAGPRVRPWTANP
jgi:adenine-specific DNA-methyltransferase